MPVNLLDLSAEELKAKGIAPIRKEYRLGAIRLYTQAVTPAAAAAAAAAADATGTADTAAVTADDALEATGTAVATDAAAVASDEAGPSRAAPVVAADGEGGHKRKPSKKQRKKERQAQDTHRVCIKFMLGDCRFGAGCKFSHDMDTFMAAKPADLPGVCPYSNQPKCPYGLSCRWAGTHKDSTGSSAEQQDAAAAADASPSAAAVGASSAQQPSEGQVPQSVPMTPFTAVEAPVNILSKDLQELLRKRQYNFGRSAQVVSRIRGSTGGEAGANGRQQNNSRGGAKKLQQRQQQGSDGQQGPAAKKQKVDSAAPEAAAVAGDAVMKDASEADAAAADEDDAAAADSTAAAPAAAAAVTSEVVNEIDELYAASCPITPHNSLVLDTPPAAAGPGAVQQPDAALIAALKQEQQQQQRQQQAAVGGVVDSLVREPRNRPKLDIAGKTYLAPLTTVGNLPFRRVCVDMGCEVTCGEMSLATNLLSGQGSEWALLKRHPSEKFFGVQVCGGYTDNMAQVSQLLDDTLGDNIDFVDINCGCPIDVICNKGAGSSLLLRPRRLEEVVRAVTGCINKPVIVKIRKGYYDSSDIAHDIIPQMPQWGAAAVTLHGRSRQQRYSRAADWDYIRRCAGIASSVGLPLIGNGDVFSPSEWQQRLAAAAEPEDPGTEGAAAAAADGCGVTTAMIGRAALIKPWIFTEIRENRLWDISASERLDLVKSFVSHGLEAWGADSRGVETTRRFLLEWLSFTHRYIPVGLLEVVPQVMSWRPPAYSTRSQLEGLLSSEAAADWVKISEMFLGPAPSGFTFVPKHKTNAYTLTADALAQLAGAAGKGALPVEEEEGEENG